MMEFLRTQQLNIMEVFIGVCGAMAVLLSVTKALKKRRRIILLAIEIGAFLLLLFDRLSYVYTGDISRTGYVMVRVTNFIVYFMSEVLVFVFNIYLFDLMKEEGGMKRVPARLVAAGIITLTGIAFVVISQFTGLYYTFDPSNVYHRAPAFVLCMIFPLAASVLQLSVVYAYRKLFGRWIYISLVVFIIGPVIATVIQLFAYGLSLVNVSVVIVAMFLYIFAYLHINDEVEQAHRAQIEYLEDEKKSIHRTFDKTVKSFVNALDGRYMHTQGHSQRVADYAKRIAELDGKSKDECEDIYYAALLHDVGRIWMDDDIVRNYGHLTEEQEEKVRQMPVIGSQILSDIDDMPDIDIGAHYHCERFDGKGYPDGLKGENIPEAARIIAAADAYDLMASEADLTPPMPAQLIHEQFVQRSGQQLDPKYAKIVMQVLDEKEAAVGAEGASSVDAVYENEFYCDEYREHVMAGILVTPEPVRIRMKCAPEVHLESDFYAPSLILFDSYDGRVHDQKREIEAYRYSEFGEVWFDGHIVCTSARNMEVNTSQKSSAGSPEDAADSVSYEITAYRQSDHVRILIDSEDLRSDVIIALPDSSLYAYIGLTGEHCHVSNVTIEKMETASNVEDIPRIADPISYTDRLESDIPNVQIDGRRTASTSGVKVTNGMRMVFHTMSLPSADLIWHCPYIVLYSSKDGTIGGSGYTEYGLIRLHGETKKTDDIAQNVIAVEKDESFTGWDAWKELNHKGYECVVHFRKLGNKITVITENGGIRIENVTTIMSPVSDVYAAITGDQVAITDIRIKKP